VTKAAGPKQRFIKMAILPVEYSPEIWYRTNLMLSISFFHEELSIFFI
jgi:hypothetical protein